MDGTNNLFVKMLYGLRMVMMTQITIHFNISFENIIISNTTFLILHRPKKKNCNFSSFLMVNQTNFIYDILQRKKVSKNMYEQPLLPFMLVVLSTGMNLTVILHLKTQQLWSIYRFKQTNATTKNKLKNIWMKGSVFWLHMRWTEHCVKYIYIMRCILVGYVFKPMCYEFDLFYV